VKGLADARIKFIPDIYYHSETTVINLNEFDTVTTIPTVDLAEPHHNIVRKIWDASSSFEVFQIINHNIPKSNIEGLLREIKSFRELRPKDKMWCYRRDSSLNYEKGVYFYSNSGLFYSRAVSWNDVIQIRSSPLLSVSIPDVCNKGMVHPEVRQRTFSSNVLKSL
ncbi:hypothetical protein RND81_04G045300, partial [Saponaria officinalis]